MLYFSLGDLKLWTAMAAGGVSGLLLGWYGLKHTRFEVTPQGRFYTPHPYIGLSVSALLIGRMLYRLFSVYAAAQTLPQPGVGTSPFAGMNRSPLTMALFGVLIGYYITYYLGILQKSRQPAQIPCP
jgi:cytochrome b561